MQTNHTEMELLSVLGRLVAGGVRNPKDRDVQALEVRAGTSAVGHTSGDASGFSSTNRGRVKVARGAQWRADCDLSEARIWPLLL